MAWDDDIEVGSDMEILGESLRGMQDRDYVGAAAALKRLRGAVGQLAAGRTSSHQPVTRRMRSPFKDSTQIGITATATFIPTAVSLTTPISATGITRVYKSFKPSKAIVNETVAITYTGSGLATVTLYAAPTAAVDILLVSAFSGADNCFPNAPSANAGINCAALAQNALGQGISWPTLNGGIDMTVGFLIRPSVLAQIATPAGYTASSVTVTIDMSLWGPSLR